MCILKIFIKNNTVKYLLIIINNIKKTSLKLGKFFFYSVSKILTKLKSFINL